MTRTFTIDNFRLKSTWSVKNKLGKDNEFIMYCTTTSTDSKTINLDLSAITSGSIIKSAFLKLNVNGAGDSFAICNGVSVGTTNAKTTNPYDVTAWFTNVGSSAAVKFTFQGYADVTTTSATCSFNDISITIDYELPNSTGTFNTTNVTVGQTITLTINPANNNYAHQVVWRINGIQYGDVVDLPLGIKQCQLSFTDDMCSYAWNTASAPCEAELITIRDNGHGSVKYPFTFNVPDTSNYRPSISSSGTLNCTAINNTFNGFVQYYTRIQFSLTGVSAGTGSSINNVAFSGWGGTVYSTSPDASGNYNATSDVLTTSGTVTIRAVVTDNRGRTVEKTTSINISAYVEPSIVAVSAKRCLQSGEVSDSGTYVNLSVRYNWANVSGNSLTIKSEYKEINETGYTAEIDQNVSANPFSKIIGNNSFGNDRSYDVKVTVTDKTGRYASASLTIPTTVYVLHFKNGGKSIGIGRAAVEPATGEAGRVDINSDWNVYVGGNNIKEIPDSVANISGQINTINNNINGIGTRVGTLETNTTASKLKETVGIGVNVIARTQSAAVPSTGDIFAETINLQDGDVWVGSLLVGASAETDIQAWFDNDTDVRNYRSYMRYNGSSTRQNMNYIGFANTSGTAHIKFTISRTANAVIMEGQSIRGDGGISDFVVQKQTNGTILNIRSTGGVAANAQLRMRKLL